MRGMFVHQISLTELNLSSFDTSNVENMRAMFGGLNIEKIYVSSKWNTSKVTNSTEMFQGKNYVGNDGNTYELNESGLQTYFINRGSILEVRVATDLNVKLFGDEVTQYKS